MNILEMFLNYINCSHLLVILGCILMLYITFLLTSSDSFHLFEDLNKNEKIKNNSFGVKNQRNACVKKEKENILKVKIISFFQNTIIENVNKFILSEMKGNINHLFQKVIISNNNEKNKKDELSIMFTESLSSLNSWNNNEVENEIFKEINWNIDNLENFGENESLVFQYIYPNLMRKECFSSSYFANLSSSQSSINSNSETEDGEEEKEKVLLSQYKLGICRTFDNCDDIKIKSNIVKEVNGNLYKIYSEGDPFLIKEKCRIETFPQNFEEIMDNYKKEGYSIIGISGKKMKMNYFQSQKIERTKCESNMIFLGCVIYKINYDGYKTAYS